MFPSLYFTPFYFTRLFWERSGTPAPPIVFGNFGGIPGGFAAYVRVRINRKVM